MADGWAYERIAGNFGPGPTSRAHYFRAGASLCRTRIYTGEVRPLLEQTDFPCSWCLSILYNEQRSAQGAASYELADHSIIRSKTAKLYQRAVEGKNYR